MKTIYLACSVLRRSLFPFLTVCLVMTVALVLLVSVSAEYRYITAARDALQTDILQNAVFFSLPYNEDGMPYLPQEISASPACDSLLLIGSSGLAQAQDGEFFNTAILSPTAIDAFDLPMQSGRYLDPSSGAPEAIVSAQYRGNLSLGDTLVLQDGTQATLVGFVQDGMPLPSLNRYGSDMSADKLYKDSDTVLLSLPENVQDGYHAVAAVIPRADASAEEKRALTEQLAQYGRTISFDALMERTELTVDAAMREKLPLPLFLLVISTLAMISVFALAIERSMREQSNYFLLGCSKRRSMGILMLAVSAVFTLPVAVNVVLLYAFPDFLRFDADAYMLGNDVFVLMLVYWAACLLLTAGLIRILYRKYSPLAFYRKNLT